MRKSGLPNGKFGATTGKRLNKIVEISAQITVIRWRFAHPSNLRLQSQLPHIPAFELRPIVVHRKIRAMIRACLRL